MSQHAPKLAALEAHAANLLSAEGRQRLERHLARCETCRRALDAVKAYEALRADARQDEGPTLSWEAFEKRLDEEPARAPARPAPQPVSNGRVVALLWPVLAVAATVLVAWIGLSGQRDEAQRAQRDAQRAPVAAVAQAPTIDGWVTLSSGAASANDGQPKLVHEGDSLRTGLEGELHAALGDGSGIVLGRDTELRVTRLRKGEVELELVRGQVFNEVRKLGAGESYAVRAGDISTHVRGTRFTVRAREQRTVSVHEGRVEVMQGARSVTLLEAGQRWSTATSADQPALDRTVHGLDGSSATWPTLQLPVLSDVRAWRVDDASIPARDGLAMRMPAGDVELAFEDAKGKLHTVRVTVAEGGTVLAESAVLDVLAADRRGTVGLLTPEQISPVVHAGIDRLRRCYERALRQDPRTAGKLLLALRVAPDGHVARATLEGETEVLPELETCVLQEARAWQFPRPEGEGPASFEVPLNFSPRR